MKQRDSRTILSRAQALIRANDIAGAESILRDRIAAQPEDADAIGMLAQLCQRTGRSGDARALLEDAWRLGCANLNLSLALIDARVGAGDNDGAAEVAGFVAVTYPQDVRPRARLANILMQTGDFRGAEEAARQALAISPGHAGALSILAENDSADGQELLAQIQAALAASAGRSSSVRTVLQFAAGRVCGKLGRYDEAFDHYSSGNALRRRDLQSQGLGYDRRAVEAEVAKLIDCFGKESFGATGASDSEMPVFVVGMARSGTSLTEQILASHPAVTGAGELPLLPRIASGLRRSHGYPANVPAGAIQMAARSYLGGIEARADRAARVVDKMPINLLHLGLIVQMFPMAHIVHCRRDPLDTCMSCFSENFRIQGLAWAYDLGDLGHMYCQYRRIMDHWRGVLPAGRLLEVDYEDTVSDLEGQARRLIDFVGLDWDDSCLAFHDTRRTVFTPSRRQVRKPIYNSSVGRWRPYAKHLAPLIAELDACGCGPEVRSA